MRQSQQLELMLILVLLTWAGTYLAQEPLVGQKQKIDVNNDILRSALLAVTPDMEKQVTNPQYVHKMGNINEAHSQVVSGLKFFVKLEMGETPCLKANTTNLDACLVTRTKNCYAEIWVQTWLNHNELQTFNCTQ